MGKGKGSPQPGPLLRILSLFFSFLKWSLILALLALLALLATLPLWIVPAVRHALPYAGIEFASVEAGPGGTIRVLEARWEDPAVSVRVNDLIIASPTVWLTAIALRKPITWIRGEGVEVHLSSAEGDRDPARSLDWDTHGIHETVRTVLRHTSRWLPSASLLNGRLVFPDGSELRLSEVFWSDSLLRLHGEAEFTKHGPFPFTVQFGPHGGSGLLVRLDSTHPEANLRLETVSGPLSLDWRATGRIAGHGMNASGGFDRGSALPDQVQLDVPSLIPPEGLRAWFPGLREIALSGRFLRTPGGYQFEIRGDGDDRGTRLRVRGEGTPESLRITDFRTETPFLQASLVETALLPLHSGGETLLKLQAIGDLEKIPLPEFQGRIEANLEMDRLHFDRPPSGELTLRADELGYRDFSLPKARLRLNSDEEAVEARIFLEGFDLSGENDLPLDLSQAQLAAGILATPEGLILKGIRGEMASARLEGEGSWSPGTETWRGFAQALRRDDFWKAGSGQLRLTAPELADFRQFLPDPLRPMGELEMTLHLGKNGLWRGSFNLDGLATFPIEPFGAIRDIAAKLHFNEDRIEVDSIEAALGGQSIQATGQLNRREFLRFSPDLEIKGENVPMVRTSGIILRTDLDLTLRENRDGIPVIGGALNFRRGFIFLELPSLRPSPAEPTRRPPYFQVEAEPFADWKLDTKIQGDRFLRIRNPVFSTLVSADLRLGGSLGEPIMTGEATLERGSFLFPFARFNIRQGRVELTEANPYVPEVFVSAGTRLYGYDLLLELTGPSTDPVLELSSAPPLESGTILQMVSTGRRPDEGAERGIRFEALGVYLGRGILDQLRVDAPDEMEPTLLEQFDLTIGADITESGRSTIEAVLPLTDRWSAIGEYDRFDDFNLNLQYKIYER